MGRVRIPKDRGLMRPNLRDCKIAHLTQKLIQALASDNLRKAEKYVGQGAYVEQYFWQRKGASGALRSCDAGLPLKKIETEATQYTPYLFVAKRGNKPLLEFMERVSEEGKEHKEGKIVQIKRELIKPKVKRDVNFYLQPHSVSVRRGRRRMTRRTYLSPKADVTTSVSMKYRTQVVETHKTSAKDGKYQVHALTQPKTLKNEVGKKIIERHTRSLG
jgi:hypothetical protein